MIFSSSIELDKHWISPPVPGVSFPNLCLAEATTTIDSTVVELPNKTVSFENVIVNGHHKDHSIKDELVKSTTQFQKTNDNHDGGIAKEMKDANFSHRIDSNYINSNDKQCVVFTERIVSSQYNRKRSRWYLQHYTSITTSTTTTPTTCL